MKYILSSTKAVHFCSELLTGLNLLRVQNKNVQPNPQMALQR